MRFSKKKAALLIPAAILAFAGTAGMRYYLDNIKLPEVAPRQVVEHYFTALRMKDYEKAYTFTSRLYYHESFNQFTDRAAMYSPDMRLEIQGETIEKDAAVVNARVVVPMPFGSYESEGSMDMVREKRAWKIVHP